MRDVPTAMTTRTLKFLTIISFTAATLFLTKGEIFFEFNSDPPNGTVNMDQSAVFHCSVNDTRVGVLWYINGNNVLPSDVDVVGLGTSSSNLTIVGSYKYNNTQVRCIATGLVDGSIYSDFSEQILRVQGTLAEVINLSCIQEENSDCIECDWEAPFSLTPIPSYAINVTRTSDVLNSEEPVPLRNSSTTAWYCLSQYGQYRVSVAAKNSAGLGNVSFENVELIPNRPASIWRDVDILTNSTNIKGHWNFTFKASTTSFLAGDYEIIAHFNDTTGTNDTTTATGNAVVDHQGQVNGSITTGKLDKGNWTMQACLKYASNRLISEPVEINTFGIRQLNFTVDGLKICVEAEFVEGSDTMECLVDYECSDNRSRGSINITRENPRNCTGDIDPNNYIMTFYDDVKQPNRIVAILQAIVGNISPEESSVIFPSSSMPSFSGSPASTNPSNADDSLDLAIAIIVPLIVIIAFISFVAFVTILILKTKKRVQKKVKPPAPADFEVQVQSRHEAQAEEASTRDIKCLKSSIPIATVIYMETEVSENRPRAPPSIEEKVQYQQVNTKNQESALYSLTTITENSVTPNIPENHNNSEYSHLNSRGYKSPHQPELECNDTKDFYSTIPLAHGNMNKEFSYAVLVKYVAPYISHKWEELGLALALTPDDIEQLKENHQGINDVFLFWEQQQTRPFTWETLIMALESINEHELVNKL